MFGFYVNNEIQEGGEGGGYPTTQSTQLSDLTWDSQSLAAQLCQTAELKLCHLNHPSSAL